MVGVCVLSIPCTVLAKPSKFKLRLPASHSTEETAQIEIGKAAAAENTPINQPESKPENSAEFPNAIRNEFKAVLVKMKAPALTELSSKAEDLAVISREAFFDLVDKLPPLSDDAKTDAALREEVKERFKPILDAKGSEARGELVRLVRESLAEKVASAESSTAKGQKEKQEIEAKIASLLAKLDSEEEKPEDEATKKKLEEALAKSQADLEESQRKAKEKLSEEKKGLDPNLLEALLAAGQNGNESGAAGSQDPGGSGAGSSGSGGGGGRGARRSSDPEKPASRDSTDKKFSDLSNALNSPSQPKESQPVAESKSSSEPFRPKKRTSTDDKETPAATTPTSNPLADLGNSNTGTDSKPSGRNLGPKSPLAPLPSSSQAGAASGLSGVGGGGAGLQAQASVGGGAGGGMSSSGGGAFPFGGPTLDSTPSAPQKYDYVRANGYLNSSGEGGVADGEGEETPEEPGQALTKGTTTSFNNYRIAPPKAVNSAEPSFVRAVGQALGNLCASGSLSCVRRGNEKVE